MSTYSIVYDKYPLWLTIDVEELTDSNFNLINKKSINLDYEILLDNWLELCQRYNYKSTAFVLGSFAKKYPFLIKKLANEGHEIASHGLTHDLVYDISFNKWNDSIIQSKNILEDIIGKEVKGYRSASWSLPFEKFYYEGLINAGYSYSSSYFPIKTYMYGNIIDKKNPFKIETESGSIVEIPIPKFGIPFSGGFYLRLLPISIQKVLTNLLNKSGVKPVVYIHPYELLSGSLMKHFKQNFKTNIDFFLAFYSSSPAEYKIERLLDIENGNHAF